MTAKEKKVAGPKPLAILTQRQFSLVEPGDWLLTTDIWVPTGEPVTIFETGTVVSYNSEQVTCDIKGETKTYPIAHCRNANINIDPIAVNDIGKLAHINDAAVLHHLKIRFVNNYIYTYAAQLLVAVNPFCSVPGLYELSNLQKYKNAKESFGFPTDLPPHTYAVAHKAFSLFNSKLQNQSCVVSGESGAGKTETARQIMQFFSAPHGGNESDKSKSKASVQDIILGSNPLLESFGNAKTLRNNNSSRFGRFLKLGMRPEQTGIISGEISQYMLELSRIDKQQKGERNYHIFYQLFKALSSDLKKKYKLRDMTSYTFLNQSGTYDVDTVDDVRENAEVNQVLKSILTEIEVDGLYQALSGILLCGNIEFKDTAKLGVDKAAELLSIPELQDIALLFGVSNSLLEKSLTVKITEIQGKSVESAISSEQASSVCHTLAKDVYSTVFNWLVDSVNRRITGGRSVERWIGILDIYGFEFFENNTYEQFLINYANEKLQQFFVQNVFRAEVLEYQAEGIDHSMIVYEDNAAVINLLDSKKSSVLALLEEQCLLGTGTSEKFTSACHQAFEKIPLYVKPRLQTHIYFGINHTAAPVLYNALEFVPKNKLKMPNELINLLRESTNIGLKNAFATVEVADSRSMKGKFVGSKFVSSMDKLLQLLQTSNAHFIRCIKPNQQKQPRLYENAEVLGQLHCLSILEAVSIVHKGFAYRASFDDFVKENEILIRLVAADLITSEPETIVPAVLNRLAIPSTAWQVGKTRVFIRKEGWIKLEQFIKQAMNTMKPLILRLQGAYQSYSLRRQHKQRQKNIILLQSLVRRYGVVKDEAKRKEVVHLVFGAVCLMKLVNIRKLRHDAAIMIQKHVRRLHVQRRFKREIEHIRKSKHNRVLTTWARGFVASRRWRQAVLAAREKRAVFLIQRIWRGHRARIFARRYKRWKQLNVAATRIQAAIRGTMGHVCSILLRY